jgi:hypothetical protein
MYNFTVLFISVPNLMCLFFPNFLFIFILIFSNLLFKIIDNKKFNYNYLIFINNLKPTIILTVYLNFMFIHIDSLLIMIIVILWKKLKIIFKIIIVNPISIHIAILIIFLIVTNVLVNIVFIINFYIVVINIIKIIKIIIILIFIIIIILILILIIILIDNQILIN